jgi:hypothetical protein
MNGAATSHISNNAAAREQEYQSHQNENLNQSDAWGCHLPGEWEAGDSWAIERQ